MLRHDAVTVAQAAQSLGIGSRRLFQLLRNHGVLSPKNVATRPYVEAGYLRNEHRSHYLRGTRIQRWYTVPLVTGAGMALLQEIVDEAAVHRVSELRRNDGLAGREQTGPGQRIDHHARLDPVPPNR